MACHDQIDTIFFGESHKQKTQGKRNILLQLQLSPGTVQIRLFAQGMQRKHKRKTNRVYLLLKQCYPVCETTKVAYLQSIFYYSYIYTIIL